jgi:DNA (cytosine-5)-methyltransferase 1
MRVLDLFSGIGGASLGLHWAGMRTVAFCERDGFCREVLRRHWPGVPVFDDVRTLSGRRLRDEGVPWAELLVGGFPCQDISVAGRGAGIAGARSGLWADMERLVAECRPRWVVAENVPGLRGRGADRVCAGLETLGYTCWPLVVGAVHAGAPHRRQRVWVVARDAADATRPGLEVGECGTEAQAARLPAERRGGWPAEPGDRRVDDGVPARVDRLKALGNAIVPANAAMVGRAILAAEAAVYGTAGPPA